jgi:hypothetical protein
MQGEATSSCLCLGAATCAGGAGTPDVQGLPGGLQQLLAAVVAAGI